MDAPQRLAQQEAVPLVRHVGCYDEKGLRHWSAARACPAPCRSQVLTVSLPSVLWYIILLLYPAVAGDKELNKVARAISLSNVRPEHYFLALIAGPVAKNVVSGTGAHFKNTHVRNACGGP